MDVDRVAEAIFRQESGRILATLIRLSGSFDLAEEALQDAFASALPAWQERGIPENPAAWITAVAHRRILDQFRRKRTRAEKSTALQYESSQHTEPDFTLEDETTHFPDDRLRLMFTCCHPALNQEIQVALTLRTLGGLTTTEIARAFLLPEPTLAQRLVRAKRKIQEARIPYEIPGAGQLAERLSGVQSVVYLIFNEGYLAAAGDDLVRVGLCDEAIRLRPTFALAFDSRGLIRRALGDLKGALQDFNEAIRLKPDSAVAIANRDSLLKQMADQSNSKTS